jgi:hypothetical protein
VVASGIGCSAHSGGSSPRREGELSGFRAEEFVAELKGQLTLHDVEGLVEVMVVQRRPTAIGE